MPCAGARRGRDRVRRRRWGRRDGGRAARREPPRVHLGRAGRPVPRLGALASLRAARSSSRLLPAAGAAAAALLARPEVEVQRLLAVAERARRERPQLWSPYVEAAVEVTRAEVIERGDVGAAVEHARRAVAAARGGRGRPERRRPREPVAGAVLRRRARRGRAESRYRRSSDPTRRMSPTATSPASGCSRWSTPSKGEPRARSVGSSGDQLRARAIPSGFLGGVAGASRAGAGVQPRPGASTRPSERRCAVSGCDARHSPPLVTLTPCSCSRKSASRDRGWRLPPATSNARAG